MSKTPNIINVHKENEYLLARRAFECEIKILENFKSPGYSLNSHVPEEKYFDFIMAKLCEWSLSNTNVSDSIITEISSEVCSEISPRCSTLIGNYDFHMS